MVVLICHLLNSGKYGTMMSVPKSLLSKPLLGQLPLGGSSLNTLQLIWLQFGQFHVKATSSLPALYLGSE